jgi:glycosyltransferase involved in cell wall biosynthesis
VYTVQLGKEWFSEQSGGLNRYYAELVRHLPAQGVGVTGLVAGSEARVSSGSAGRVHAFAPRGASLVARLAGVRLHVRRALAAHPGLLVAHFALYAAPCLDLMRDTPLVVHFHGPWSAESRREGAGVAAARFKEWLERTVYRRASRLVVLSRAFGDILAREHRIGADRIRVIPGGVDTRRFAPTHTRGAARHVLGWPADRPIVLVVRRLVRRMGLENLLASVAHARADVPDLLVIVAGGGPLAEELRTRAADAGLEDHVRFTGVMPDEDLPLAYQAADVSMVPSIALEGFGLVVAESLASGTPVLVTDVGGLPETIEGFAPQCVIHDRGSRGLAAAMTSALRGHHQLPSRDACVEYARARFDWTTIAARVRGVYAEACS